MTASPDATPIACTLEAADRPGRVAAWEAALARVASREAIDGGVRLSLVPGEPLAALVDLVVAEQACCSFFAFAVTVDGRGAGLEVTAPPEAQELVRSLFGGP